MGVWNLGHAFSIWRSILWYSYQPISITGEQASLIPATALLKISWKHSYPGDETRIISICFGIRRLFIWLTPVMRIHIFFVSPKKPPFVNLHGNDKLDCYFHFLRKKPHDLFFFFCFPAPRNNNRYQFSSSSSASSISPGKISVSLPLQLYFFFLFLGPLSTFFNHFFPLPPLVKQFFTLDCGGFFPILTTLHRRHPLPS